MSKYLRVKIALCAGVLALGAGASFAQPVSVITLKSLDGKVVMTGELQGFEAGQYSIIVAGLGLVSIAEELVTCQFAGGDCTSLVSRS